MLYCYGGYKVNADVASSRRRHRFEVRTSDRQAEVDWSLGSRSACRASAMMDCLHERLCMSA
jgi:hypothetical protein